MEKGINLLLENYSCDQKKCAYIQAYYNSKNVVYSRVALVNDRGTDEIVPYLHEIRNTFLENIKSQISSYFPMNDLILFNIFRPSMIPSKSEAPLTYSVQEITRLCQETIWKNYDSQIRKKVVGRLTERNRSLVLDFRLVVSFFVDIRRIDSFSNRSFSHIVSVVNHIIGMMVCTSTQ